MSIKNLRTLMIRLPFFLLSTALISYAHASCSPMNGWDDKRLTFNFPARITVQADAALGQPFYESTTSSASSGEAYARCGGVVTTGTKYVNGWWANGAGIAPTNVPGVGIRIYWMASGVMPYLVPDDPMNTFTVNDGFTMSWRNSEPTWKIELIKTGQISGGALQTGDYVTFGAGGILITTLRIGGGGEIVPVGCTVNQPTVIVPMGKNNKSDFTGVGSSTAWHDFDIGLRCNQYAKINVRIDAAADNSAPGLMELDRAPGDIAASGVGIQLYYRSNNRPVTFGQEAFYQQSPYGGNEVVQLKARYYQTSERVIPGTANGTATFTLTYK